MQCRIFQNALFLYLLDWSSLQPSSLKHGSHAMRCVRLINNRMLHAPNTLHCILIQFEIISQNHEREVDRMDALVQVCPQSF